MKQYVDRPNGEPARPLILRRPYRRFPVQCAVTYNVGTFQGQGTVRNLLVNGWRLSGDVPMRPAETLSWTVTLQNEPRIKIPEAVEPYAHARLRQYVKRLVSEPTHA